MPLSQKQPTPESIMRCFPSSTPQTSVLNAVPQLNTLTLQEQQFLIMKDLILIFSGMEGNYIRTASTSSVTSMIGYPAASKRGHKQHVTLVVDNDSMDISLAHQVPYVYCTCI